MEKSIRKLDVMLLFILLLSIFLVINRISMINKNYRDSAENLAIVLGGELQLAINDQFTVMSSVEAYARLHHDGNHLDGEFKEFVEKIVESKDYIKNISLAPDGIQKYVYPLEGNEIVIGHDLINDERENVRNDVARTIETREIAISGPYTLRQGGVGLIARKAIYFDETFWGLIAMVTDFDKLIENTNLQNVETDFLIYVTDKESQPIYDRLEYKGKEIVEMMIELPEDHIHLAIGSSESSQRKLALQKLQWWFVLLCLITFITIIYRQDRNNLIFLKKRLRKRTYEINALNKELDHSKMIAISSLIKGLSHEINTPLGSSLVTSTHVKSLIDKLINSKSDEILLQEEYLKLISNSIDMTIGGIEKSIAILEKLRNISALEQDHSYKNYDLKDQLINSNFETLATSSDKNIHLDIQCPDNLEFLGNPNDIIQIITLLIDNSISHGFVDKKKGNIQINVTDYGSYVEFIYSDDGIGINPEIRSNIFEPFYTVDMSTFSGLGLYTIYVIVTQKMNGQITISKELKQGAEFILRIPKNI